MNDRNEIMQGKEGRGGGNDVMWKMCSENYKKLIGDVEGKLDSKRKFIGKEKRKN